MNYTVIIIYDPIIHSLRLTNQSTIIIIIIYYCEQWNYCTGLNYLFLSVVYDTTLTVVVVLVVVYYN